MIGNPLDVRYSMEKSIQSDLKQVGLIDCKHSNCIYTLLQNFGLLNVDASMQVVRTFRYL